MKFIFFIFIITLLFLLYVECSLGGVMYRVNASGQYTFNLINGIHYMIEPLRNSFLWKTEVLDVNYIFILGVSSMFYYFFFLN